MIGCSNENLWMMVCKLVFVKDDKEDDNFKI